MLRFRIFGIPFTVTGYFWLGCVLLSGLGNSLSPRVILHTVVWTACVFVSIVLHELGHALAGRRFGATPYVVLHAIGGMTHLPGRRLARGRSILVSLAGPGVGLAVWALVRAVGARLGPGPYDLTDPIILAVLMAVDALMFINGLWSIFNLLPILPLDGGHVLRDALGPRWTGLTRKIGGVAAGLLVAWCLRERQIYLTLFFGYLAYVNFRGEARSLPGGVQ